MDIGSGQGGDGAAYNLTEFLIFHGGLGDNGKISGGCVVVGVGKTVAVGKMGAGTAKLLGFLIHEIHEFLPGAADVFGNHVGSLTGGYHQQGL